MSFELFNFYKIAEYTLQSNLEMKGAINKPKTMDASGKYAASSALIR